MPLADEPLRPPADDRKAHIVTCDHPKRGDDAHPQSEERRGACSCHKEQRDGEEEPERDEEYNAHDLLTLGKELSDIVHL